MSLQVVDKTTGGTTPVAGRGNVPIDDTATGIDKVWSSQKVNTELSTKLSYADNAILGAKNLLPNDAVSQTVNGITFTVNSDGSVTVNGTASAWTDLLINRPFYLTNGNYIFSIGDANLPTDAVALVYGRANGSWTLLAELNSGSVSFTASSTYEYYSIQLGIDSGVAINNATIYPMIRLATDTDDTYVPYAKTNKELTDAHKVSTLTVDTTNWTQDVTSQSGTTLYKKQVSLNHVYANPSVDIGSASGSVLPTTAEQEAYDLLLYVTVDDTVPCLYLYASDIPTDAFYINVEGVD